MMRIILVFLCLCSLVWSEDAPKRLSLSNESVAVFVTNTESEKGRFAIETTGGDPSRDTDNNQPLIYGRPVPWTSYTTLRIDGKSFVFGGKSSKRMASGVGYGVVKKQIQNESEIITVTDFDGVEVMQILSFLRNPMSRVKDMIHIEYVVTNKRSKSHQLGLRLMLDTMLGKNDGAPFRLKQHAYQSEQSFSGDSLAPFWQAFDALNAPTVIAQGLLTDPRLNLTTPDRVLLSNWGLLTDNAWTIKYKEGRSFVREGELELDTALALYWNERTLAPSESVRFRSAYGLGGVALAPGQLSLGLAIPSEFDALSPDPQLLVAYVMNNGGYTSQDTELALDIPNDFQVLQGNATLSIGEFPVGESRQLALSVKPKSTASTGEYAFNLSVKSANLESNRLTRRVDVLGPPKVELIMDIPESVVAGPLTYVTVKATVKNASDRWVRDINVNLSDISGLQLPDFELSSKRIASLKPGASRDLSWVVQIQNDGASTQAVELSLVSPVLTPLTVKKRCKIEALSSSLALMSSKSDLKKGDVFYVDLKAFVPKAFKTGALTIRYPKDRLHLLRHTLHPAFESARSLFKHVRGETVIDNLDYTRGAFNGSLFKLHFLVKETGSVEFELLNDGQLVSKKLLESQ